MNIIDIIAIIPYFITLATVVAEEEDTLNLPKAPVSPQVASQTNSQIIFHFLHFFSPIFCCFVNDFFSVFVTVGQVNESGYVLSNIAGDTFSSSVSNIQII